ncbi:class I SAM-dependent methyltransferase [Hyphomonas johnsonii]|uniref:Type 11 methyltransferase n=1 Tax=Hyphomonas johnsonii MHS-2 TaxID=1280950 RepID=A0A059FAM7_9PROT|nr:methyltransferase domain-containing protein [Hyphomonas johnsonii]KCZ87578.1 type 11 methyltransferase [Hyphomonas johnsonii MHS-2]
MTELFFDSYPRFYETSLTRRLPNRLHQRWRKIIVQNKAALEGARVLDLACHDGRWSFAALKAGAAYVEGVEGRQELVDSANENFESYGISKDAYRFSQGDVVDFLTTETNRKFDVILNLGFFYHTLKHLEIIERMAQFGAHTFIFDTAVDLSKGNIISIELEAVSDPRNAIDHLDASRKMVPVGRISRSALALMLNSVGYDCIELDWHTDVDDFSECRTYENRKRGTFIATRR